MWDNTCSCCVSSCIENDRFLLEMVGFVLEVSLTWYPMCISGFWGSRSRDRSRSKLHRPCFDRVGRQPESTTNGPTNPIYQWICWGASIVVDPRYWYLTNSGDPCFAHICIYNHIIQIYIMCMDIAYTVDVDICHHLQEPSETHSIWSIHNHTTTAPHCVAVWLSNTKPCFTSGWNDNH